VIEGIIIIRLDGINGINGNPKKLLKNRWFAQTARQKPICVVVLNSTLNATVQRQKIG
jgi:hypothetical protein